MSLWKCWISGNATLTIVESRKAGKAPKAATSSNCRGGGLVVAGRGVHARRRSLADGIMASDGAALQWRRRHSQGKPNALNGDM